MSTRTGFVAIVGRPNVGKSTLMNRILGQKLSITSRKPQTTRHQILGILTEEDTQIVFVDTPGIHKAHDKAINRYMNRAATTAVKDVDLVVMVVDRMRWTDEDEMVLTLPHSSSLSDSSSDDNDGTSSYLWLGCCSFQILKSSPYS